MVLLLGGQPFGRWPDIDTDAAKARQNEIAQRTEYDGIPDVAPRQAVVWTGLRGFLSRLQPDARASTEQSDDPSSHFCAGSVARGRSCEMRPADPRVIDLVR